MNCELPEPDCYRHLVELVQAGELKESELDDLVAPMRHNIGGFIDHLAVAPDPIARNVGADIEVDPERGNTGVTDLGHADDRAWLWIELAKPVKRGRKLLG